MKKALSVFLCVVMLLTGTASVQAETVASSPIYVYTAEDLYAVRENLDGHYVLMADIDLSEYTAAGGKYDHNGNGWLPIGANDDYTAVEFTGVFDGNSHTVYGLRVELSTGSSDISKICVGLFGHVSGSIKNLTVSGSVQKTLVSRRSYVGGITGYCTGTVENCAAEVTVYNTGANSYAGGIAGNVWKATVRQCRNSGNITAEYTASDYYSYAGGIVGYAQTATIVDCFNEGVISGRCEGVNTYFAGGICGNMFDSEIHTCYHVGDTQNASRATGIAAITDGTITNSYCLEGRGNAVTGVTALSSEQMMQQDSFIGFDFYEVWIWTENQPYPMLRSLIIDLGDVDRNGIINMIDAYVLFAVASTGEMTVAVNRCGDVNGDRQIDMRDAFLIYRIASGG